MKNILFGILSILAACLLFFTLHGTQAGYLDKLNNDPNKAVTTDDISDDNPFSQGSHNPATGIKGLYYNGQIFSFLEAQDQTLKFIQKIINWTLMIVGTVALIYLIYNGFLMLTAAGDENQFKKGAKSARTTAIALIGIGVSALIVNLILYLIDVIT